MYFSLVSPARFFHAPRTLCARHAVLRTPLESKVPRSVRTTLLILELATRHYIQVLSFHTLAHSSALTQKLTILFSIASALFAKTSRGGEQLTSYSPAQCVHCRPVIPPHARLRESGALAGR